MAFTVDGVICFSVKISRLATKADFEAAPGLATKMILGTAFIDQLINKAGMTLKLEKCSSFLTQSCTLNT